MPKTLMLSLIVCKCLINVLNEERKKMIIDIFFAGTITIGLEKFFYESLLKETKGIPFLFNASCFAVVFFWSICQWIAYNEAVKKNKTTNGIKLSTFGIEIILFSIIFVLINISYIAYNFTPWFFLSFFIWYIFACLWYLSECTSKSEAKCKCRKRLRYLISYLVVFILAIYLSNVESYHYLIIAGGLVITIVSAILFLRKNNESADQCR
jgi:hypothetical protein